MEKHEYDMIKAGMGIISFIINLFILSLIWVLLNRSVPKLKETLTSFNKSKLGDFITNYINKILNSEKLKNFSVNNIFGQAISLTIRFLTILSIVLGGLGVMVIGILLLFFGGALVIYRILEIVFL